jgi:flagellar hook-associated protein 3 FlgL
MRITNRMIVNDSINKMSDSLAKVYDLQKKASTGKKYLNASDNPSNAASVFTLKSTLQISQVYETTAQNTNDWMASSDFAMQRASDLAQKAISAAMKGLSDTQGAESRKTLGAEIDGLLKEAVDVANTKHLDRYIFSGFTTNIQPFTTNVDPTDSTKIVGINFKGVDYTTPPPPASPAFQAIHRDVGPGETVTVNIDGFNTFNNLLQTLINVRDALNVNDMTALRSGAVDLDTALNDVTLATTINGSRMRTLEAAQERITTSNTEIKALLSQKEEVDMAEVAAQLTSQENIYQTVVTISSRMSSMVNLFESLR